MKAICAALVLMASAAAASAADAPPLDGAGVTLNDPLLDHMAGHWTMTGTLAGRPVKHTVDAEWVLAH